MIKLIATGYSEKDSCEEIFLNDNLNIVRRRSVEGINNASFVAVKDKNIYFVSEESGEDAKIHKVDNGVVTKTIQLSTKGIVYLSFLEKSGIILSGSYTLGDVFIDEESKFCGSSIHCVISDYNERFLYATDIKSDKIYIYDLKEDILVDEVSLPSGCGPRHLKFYKDFLYLVTEYSNEIFVFLHNANNGRLEFISKYNSVEKDLEVINYASAIDIKDNILAVGNRGKNVVSFFEILDDEKLKYLHKIDSLGDWPRDVKFYKNYLFVANERSGKISIFNTKDKMLVGSINKPGVNYLEFIKEDFYGLQD